MLEKPGNKRLTRNRTVDVLLLLLLILFAGLILFSGRKLSESRKEYEAGDAVYASLASTLIHSEAPSVSSAAASSVFIAASSEMAEEEPEMTVDFESLKAINDQIVGWICSDTGIIDYPVLHGKDNSYYLDHLPDGTYNKNGSIFVDCRNLPLFGDRNTIIYGHNMRTGTMFGELVEYGNDGYYEEHPTLQLITPDGSFELQIFSGYVTSGNSDIYRLTFEDDTDFTAYLERIRSLSDFSTDVEVTAQDKIITLSTCTYDYEDARYVVHCKLVPA